MDRRRRWVIAGTVAAILGTLSSGLSYLEAGRRGLGVVLVLGAAVGATVLGWRLRMRSRVTPAAEPAPAAIGGAAPADSSPPPSAS